jgi:Spy/CpxP family protein refolding chaperone
MRTSKFWKIIGLLLLVFLAGGVTGGVGTYVFTKRALEAAFDFDRWPDRGVRMLDDRLTLTPEQKVRVRVIQERLAQQMKEHFRDSMAESGRILLSGGAEIDAELTAEQRVIHAEMKRELRAGFRQHFQIELPEDEDSREGLDL